MIGIKAIGTYFPKKKLSNKTLCKKFPEINAQFLQNKVGIENRYIADQNEASSDLAIKAIQHLLGENPYFNKNKIDLLITVTQNPDYRLPHTSAIIQHKLDLHHLPSFDMNLGCSGFVYALATAKSMMRTLNMENALIATADMYSKIINKQDKNTRTIFSDAGAAIWLSQNAENELLDFDLGTDGSGFDSLILSQSGSRIMKGEAKNKKYLTMDGKKIFYFMMKVIPNSIEACLKKNNLLLADIDFFVFHQASQYLLENLGKVLNLAPEKIVYYLKDMGNTVSSTIPIALKQLMLKNNLEGRKVLISGFGVGLSWATNIIQF